MTPGASNWRLPQADMTAGWGELADYLLGLCQGAGKTIAGQEGDARSQRSRREVAVERVQGRDTDLERKSPTTAWLWRYTLVLTYPGRQKSGTAADSLNDAEGVAKLITTANPERGWRLHVSGCDGQQEGEHFRVRLQVEVRADWFAGDAQGLAPTSAEVLAGEERP